MLLASLLGSEAFPSRRVHARSRAIAAATKPARKENFPSDDGDFVRDDLVRSHDPQTRIMRDFSIGSVHERDPGGSGVLSRVRTPLSTTVLTTQRDLIISKF